MGINKEFQLVLELLKDYGIFSFASNSKIEFYKQKNKNLVNLMNFNDSNYLNEENALVNNSVLNNSTLDSKTQTRVFLKNTNSNYNMVNNEVVSKLDNPHSFSSGQVTNSQNAINNKLKNVKSLEELKNILVNFNECSLAKTATNTVFGVGNPNADLLMIGEAPGAEEDLQGKPFVGKSGQLLNKALSTINVFRDNIFTTNTIFWRPPGNRNPTPAEVDLCKPFIKKIISLIKPKMILIVGRVAAVSLLEEDIPISKIRGKWLLKSWGFDNEIIENINIRVIYHPAYLLRNPKQKKVFWFDLIEISNQIVNLNLTV